MEQVVLEDMHRRLDAYLCQGKFEERKIILFGSNESAERMIEYFEKHNLAVHWIVDNNPKKAGTMLNGVQVSLPEKKLRPKQEGVVILIASRYYSEMLLQLEDMGYREDIEVFKTAEFSTYSDNLLTEEVFDEHCQVVLQGEIIYQRIESEFPNTEKMFVCPPGALGDVYVGISFVGQYMEQHKISNCTIVVRKGACAKIGCLFGFEKSTVALSKEEMDALLQYLVFVDLLKSKVLILSHRYPYANKIFELGNYKGINFVDHFRYSLFQLGEPAKPSIPIRYQTDEARQSYVDDLFLRYNLEKGNTVILFPYANTASRQPVIFWEGLAQTLIENGCVVCTNSSGANEPEIAGTKAVFFDLRYALDVVEAAGNMIALRSGMCDVLATAQARKIVLYPNRLYGAGTFMEFYSLKKLYDVENVVELIWNDDVQNMKQLVLDALEEQEE